MKNGCTVIVLLCRINVYTEPGKMASTGFHDFSYAIKHDEKKRNLGLFAPNVGLG